jgi:hypothetical protein
VCVYTRLLYIVHSISIPKEKKDKGKAFPPFLFRVLVVLVDTRSGSIVPPSLSLSLSLSGGILILNAVSPSRAAQFAFIHDAVRIYTYAVRLLTL